MRLVVVTYGTEGDTRPLAALCRALLDSGHEARLLADRGTLAIAQSLAMPTTPLAGDINGSLQPGGSLSNVITTSTGFSGMANALAQIANANTEAGCGRW